MSKTIKKSISFGLIWKALFAVTVSTVLASGCIFALGTYTYNKNYRQKIEGRHLQYEMAFSSVINQLKHKETELGWLIPSVINNDSSKEKALTEMITRMDHQWFKIELESDIRSIFLFEVSGGLKGEWGNLAYRSSELSVWIKEVVSEERSQSKIVCDINCFQYHALPFLHNGAFLGVFVFASSINDIVLQMKEITNADIGILIPANDSPYVQQQSGLPLWSLRIPALTNFSKNYTLLESLQQRYPDTVPEKSISYTFHDETYDIFTIPFGEDSSVAKLVLIDNITQDLLEKQTAIKLYIVSGLSSILLSGVILFLLFIRPTAKLKKIINLLPLLAEKKYREVKQSLPVTKGPRLFSDETDILDAATHHLIDTLTKLDQEVEERNLILIKRGHELNSERHFVSNILDAAQVIIMRLDQIGQILSINQFGETLTGYDENGLVGKHLFTDLIYDNESYEVINSVIPDLLEKKYTTYKHDSTLSSFGGEKLYISWFFSVIQNVDTQPEILVVGLDLSERRAVETKLAWLADHDPLTGLFNRRRFGYELHRVLAEAKRLNQTGALIFFDVDQFKYINDSSGHQAGDYLLTKIAEELKRAVSQTDIVARFGGDEFVVLSPQTTMEAAEILINNIFARIKTVEVISKDILHKVSVSAGLLIFPVDGYTEQDLMASVDVAMYKAKDLGRGQWCIASPSDMGRTDAIHRVNWKSKIEKALVDERFILYFQPIMRIVDKTISHYECLLRMVGENDEIIPPGPFICVAEQTGLIKHIDIMVMKMAFLHQKEFTAKGIKITLSVNLSGEFISNPDAFKICTTLLDSYGVKAEQFIFEVTETQAVTNLHSANSFVTKLTQIGGQFALDDFGVGFSSMNYLKKIPVQYLKIDGEFIKALPSTYEDRLFVKAINEVAQGMGIKTIAEFVENDEILEVLLGIGVDYAQGYGIGKPMSYPEFL